MTLEVFLQAFYDLGLLDDMEMNTLELSAFSPTDFTEALAEVMANEASNLTQYGASANATSNVSEMTAAYSNAVRGIALNFIKAMNHPAFDRTAFISAINAAQAADLFNAQMVALDTFSGPDRYVNSDLAQALKHLLKPGVFEQASVFEIGDKEEKSISDFLGVECCSQGVKHHTITTTPGAARRLGPPALAQPGEHRLT